MVQIISLSLSTEVYNLDYLGLIVAALIFAFLMALALGANDVANSFGISVGSQILTLRQASALAVIFETSGKRPIT